MTFEVIDEYIRFNKKHDPRGCIAAPTDWPEKYHEFIRDADQKDIRLENCEVYHGLRDDFFLRCDATSGLIQLMIARWNLSLVDNHHKAVQNALTSVPPTISLLGQPTSDIDYYVSREYMPGGEWKGHLYCVIVLKKEKKVVVRYYYNF